MTLTREFTVKLEMTSECSEADLSVHIDSVVENMKSDLKDHERHSWNTELSTDWDTHYFVKIEVTV